MVDQTIPNFLKAGLYLSYTNYFATGEGLTSYLAVSGTSTGSQRVLKERAPEYFHRGIVTTAIDVHADEDAKRMIEWIPLPARETLRSIPPGSGHYFAEIHYNLS